MSPSQPWLVSARFDLTWFVLPALLSLLLGACAGHLTGQSGETPTWAWVAFVLLIDVAHVHATTLRVYLDTAERTRRPFLYTAVPVAAWPVGVGLYALSAAYFWRALAYLAAFHFIRQQIGWGRLYRKRNGEMGRIDRFTDDLVLYAATLYPLIFWHSRLPRPFQWFVQGDFVQGIPPGSEAACFSLWLLAIAGFVVRQIVRALRRQPISWGKVCLVVATVATWYAGIVIWQNDFAFTVTNVIAHGVPYMAISFRVGAHRWRGASQPSMLRSIFLSRSALLFVLMLGALAFAEEWLWDAAVWHDHATLFPGSALVWPLQSALTFVVPLLAVPQITHYVLDAYLWRLDGSNPGLDTALGVPASRRDFGSTQGIPGAALLERGAGTT